MRRLCRAALVLLFAVAVLVLASPFVLYRMGLHGIEGVPRQPVQLALREQQAMVWKNAGGEGVARIGTMNPYSVALRLVIAVGSPHPAGERVVWWVASDYLRTHQRHQGMAWWHLSGIALTIWLSRNWSNEEILSAAFHARYGLAGAGRKNEGLDQRLPGSR